MRNNLIILLILILVSGCANKAQQILGDEESQLQLRKIQSREFETTDKKKTLRNVIQTMQDLGFVIDKADYDLGSVTGTKLDGYKMRLTATAMPKGKKRMIVRANALYNRTVIKDGEPYQQFFNSLQKSMFLTANEVD